MDLIMLLIKVMIFVYAVVIHEVAHGKVAEYFGDVTARVYGRLTLNPVPHIDLMGTIIFPLLFLMSGSPVVFGWAKPVPVNAYHFKDMDHDMAIVGLAGPLSNLSMAFIASLFIRFIPMSAFFTDIFFYCIQINILFFVFNLIPLPPLDGSRILRMFLPYELKRVMDNLEHNGFILLFLILLFPGTQQLLRVMMNSVFAVLLYGL